MVQCVHYESNEIIRFEMFPEVFVFNKIIKIDNVLLMFSETVQFSHDTYLLETETIIKSDLAACISSELEIVKILRYSRIQHFELIMIIYTKC